jgi:hypothetical protein
MRPAFASNQVPGLAAGIVMGLTIAWLWPHEPAYATTGDRAPHFSMVTIPVSDAAKGIVDPVDGVFVLDLVTAQLKGAVINRQNGTFASFYFRDLAGDFNVAPGQAPEFCMVTGYAQIPNQGGKQMASGMLYIGELNSGKVAGYAFPWVEKGMGGPVAITPMDVFQWRPAPKQKPGQ